MNSKDYAKLTAGLLDQVHDLHAATGKAIEAIGGSAQSATAEWQLFYSLMRMAGVMADMLNDNRHPRGSAIIDPDTDEETAAKVLAAESGVRMVCTGCGTPVSYSGGDAARGGVGGVWTHDDELDEAHCDRWNAHEVITARVSAGA